MILIGQTIMSPNGDRNSILTQCEFSVDFSFLRSLRASQLDAIYYILLVFSKCFCAGFWAFSMLRYSVKGGTNSSKLFVTLKKDLKWDCGPFCVSLPRSLQTDRRLKGLSKDWLCLLFSTMKAFTSADDVSHQILHAEIRSFTFYITSPKFKSLNVIINLLSKNSAKTF